MAGYRSVTISEDHCHLRGLGPKQIDHRAQAAVWYPKAADKGNVFAQINLGSMHSEGLPKDHVLAYIWGYLVVSRAQDDETREVANKTRDNLVQRMSPEKIGVARGWKPAN